MTTAILVCCLASGLGQSRPPTLSVTAGQRTHYSGGLVRCDVKIGIQDGLHAYQNPPSQDYMIPLEIEAGDGTTVESVRYPKGTLATVGGESSPVAVYEGQITVPVFVRLGKGTGNVTVNLKLKIQQCNDQTCFPPETKELHVAVAAEPAPASLFDRKAADLAVLAGRH